MKLSTGAVSDGWPLCHPKPGLPAAGAQPPRPRPVIPGPTTGPHHMPVLPGMPITRSSRLVGCCCRRCCGCCCHAASPPLACCKRADSGGTCSAKGVQAHVCAQAGSKPCTPAMQGRSRLSRMAHLVRARAHCRLAACTSAPRLQQLPIEQLQRLRRLRQLPGRRAIVAMWAGVGGCKDPLHRA